LDKEGLNAYVFKGDNLVSKSLKKWETLTDDDEDIKFLLSKLPDFQIEVNK